MASNVLYYHSNKSSVAARHIDNEFYIVKKKNPESDNREWAHDSWEDARESAQ